jgi:hypothetical protein
MHLFVASLLPPHMLMWRGAQVEHAGTALPVSRQEPLLLRRGTPRPVVQCCFNML